MASDEDWTDLATQEPSPPRPKSVPRTPGPARAPVSFSGGDPTVNFAVYEPDRTVVPRFRHEWNYQVMPTGGVDAYDLEMQVRACAWLWGLWTRLRALFSKHALEAWSSIWLSQPAANYCT